MTARSCCAAVTALLLSACASKPAEPPLAVTPGCIASIGVPPAPERTLKTDQSAPGAVVRAAIVNRAKWIAHADELEARLNSCK